jgi:hypothetical protein
MSHLPNLAGWVFLIGGIAGVVRVWTAQTFSWADPEFSSEEDRRREVPMTPLRRWILIAVCIGFTGFGVTRIQLDHDWNLFHSNTHPTTQGNR